MVLRVALVLSFLLAAQTGIVSAHPGNRSNDWSPERLAVALQQPVPTNDLWKLTARLKLHTTKPIAKIVNSRPPNYAVGRQDKFWVLNSNSNRYTLDRATIVCETPHLYLYVQNSVHVSQSVACRSAAVFERHIYPTDRRIFGNEWIPGIDDDAHITVFYGHVPGVGGYYSGEDEYPRVVNRYSNQREMLFINSDASSVGFFDFDSTLAHEFQHMIHWHLHAQDEAWSNEGASMLAQVLNGYSADGVDTSYAAHPVQLDSWTDGPTVNQNYGAGFLWMDYLYERFGAKFIHAMLADRDLSGLALAQAILSSRGHGSLRHVFGNWIVANYLNSKTAGDKYGYRYSHIHIPPTVTTDDSTTRYVTSLHPYTPLYVRLKAFRGNKLLHFAGAPSIPVISDHSSAPFWWSNRCDFCDTSMTRPVDLRSAVDPVLSFSAWYDVEKNYDYAYVEISNDNGQTWHSLQTNVSGQTNPNGSNLGNGITGKSTKVAGNADGWVPVRADLDSYVGEKVLLRFEYVTDDEYNGQGLAISNINIARSGFSDTVGSSRWRLAGFEPVETNQLPMRWTVREITTSLHRSPTVNTVSVPQSGKADLFLDHSDGVAGTTLAIFGQAPKTTASVPVQVFSRGGF